MVQVHKRSIQLIQRKEHWYNHSVLRKVGYTIVTTTPIGMAATTTVLIHWKMEPRSDEGVSIWTQLSEQERQLLEMARALGGMGMDAAF